MNKLVLIAGGSTLLYLFLAVLMGVLPGIELSQIPPGPGVKPLTPLQAEGRDVYVANGCSYCHTQQVRPLPMDKVFGRPSAPGDFAYQTPELLGSERTGPDLTNIGARNPSKVWQYIHLYNPRAVVPQSIMPRFEWLFNVVDKAPSGVEPVPVPKAFAPDHGVVVPTHKAEALVAYLLSLKQPPLPGSNQQGGTAAQSSTGSAGPSGGSSAPVAGGSGGFDQAKGKALYAANCSSCHQAGGTGLPGVFPPLAGNSAVNDSDPTKQIHVVLHGLQGSVIDGKSYGSVMPPFAASLSDADIANIINHERTSWGNHGKLVTAKQVATERAKGK